MSKVAKHIARMKMKEMASRIKKRMEELELKQVDLQKATGAAQGTVSGWLTGRNGVSRGYRENLENVLQVPRGWVESGSVAPTPERGNEELTTLAHAVRWVPLLSWVEAGEIKDLAEVLSNWDHDYVPITSTREHLIALEVRGTSCNRVFKPGDVVIIDLDDIDPVEGRYYVFRVNQDGISLKKFRANPPQLVPDSDDPSHHPTRFNNSDEVTILGRVIKRVSDF